MGITAYLDFFDKENEVLVLDYKFIFTCKPAVSENFCANGLDVLEEIRGKVFNIRYIQHVFDGDTHYLLIELKMI